MPWGHLGADTTPHPSGANGELSSSINQLTDQRRGGPADPHQQVKSDASHLRQWGMIHFKARSIWRCPSSTRRLLRSRLPKREPPWHRDMIIHYCPPGECANWHESEDLPRSAPPGKDAPSSEELMFLLPPREGRARGK